jgi:hypothetical protein
MPNSRQDEDSYELLLLFPELIAGELSTMSDKLIDIIKSIVASDLRTHYRNDTRMIREHVRSGNLQPDRSLSSYLGLLEGKQTPGKLMKVNVDTLVATGTEAKFKHVIACGAAVEGPIWSHVSRRRQMLLQIIALLMDEMRGEVFQRSVTRSITTTLLQCASSTCVNTKCADGAGLLLCSRCKFTAYCSRECQSADWKLKHKRVCGKK